MPPSLKLFFLSVTATAWCFLHPPQLSAQDDPGKTVLEKMKKERGDDLKTVLEGGTKIAVVTHSKAYDHVEKVLDGLGIKYDLLQWSELAQKDLSPYAAVFVNCSTAMIRPNSVEDLQLARARGQPPPMRSAVGKDIQEKIRSYVESGGFLFTSDWAVMLTTTAFPEYLTLSQKRSGESNETFPIHPQDADHPFLKGVFADTKNTALKDRKAEWTTEKRSILFDVVPAAKPKVKILMTSEELEKKHGSPLVGVTFTVGQGGISTGKYEGTKEGAVLHVVGHFFQQELGNKNNKEVAKMYQLILNFVFEAKKTRGTK